MRTPPPVSVRLGPEPAWQTVCAGLSGLAAACLTLWVALHAASWIGHALWTDGSWWPLDLLVLSFWAPPVLLGIAAGWVGRRYATVEPLQLAWTGQAWQARAVMEGTSPSHSISGQAENDAASVPTDCNAPGVLALWRGCEPTLMIDLGSWILLRLRVPSDGSLRTLSLSWRAVSASQMDPWSWHGLRVALHCARSSAAGDRGADPAALT